MGKCCGAQMSRNDLPFSTNNVRFWSGAINFDGTTTTLDGVGRTCNAIADKWIDLLKYLFDAVHLILFSSSNWTFVISKLPFDNWKYLFSSDWSERKKKRTRKAWKKIFNFIKSIVVKYVLLVFYYDFLFFLNWIRLLLACRVTLYWLIFHRHLPIKYLLLGHCKSDIRQRRFRHVQNSSLNSSARFDWLLKLRLREKEKMRDFFFVLAIYHSQKPINQKWK